MDEADDDNLRLLGPEMADLVLAEVADLREDMIEDKISDEEEFEPRSEPVMTGPFYSPGSLLDSSVVEAGAMTQTPPMHAANSTGNSPVGGVLYASPPLFEIMQQSSSPFSDGRSASSDRVHTAIHSNDPDFRVRGRLVQMRQVQVGAEPVLPFSYRYTIQFSSPCLIHHLRFEFSTTEDEETEEDENNPSSDDNISVILSYRYEDTCTEPEMMIMDREHVISPFSPRHFDEDDESEDDESEEEDEDDVIHADDIDLQRATSNSLLQHRQSIASTIQASNTINYLIQAMGVVDCMIMTFQCRHSPAWLAKNVQRILVTGYPLAVLAESRCMMPLLNMATYLETHARPVYEAMQALVLCALACQAHHKSLQAVELLTKAQSLIYRRVWRPRVFGNVLDVSAQELVCRLMKIEALKADIYIASGREVDSLPFLIRACRLVDVLSSNEAPDLPWLMSSHQIPNDEESLSSFSALQEELLQQSATLLQLWRYCLSDNYVYYELAGVRGLRLLLEQCGAALKQNLLPVIQSLLEVYVHALNRFEKSENYMIHVYYSSSSSYGPGSPNKQQNDLGNQRTLIPIPFRTLTLNESLNGLDSIFRLLSQIHPRLLTSVTEMILKLNEDVIDRKKETSKTKISESGELNSTFPEWSFTLDRLLCKCLSLVANHHCSMKLSRSIFERTCERMTEGTVSVIEIAASRFWQHLLALKISWSYDLHPEILLWIMESLNLVELLGPKAPRRDFILALTLDALERVLLSVENELDVIAAESWASVGCFTDTEFKDIANLLWKILPSLPATSITSPLLICHWHRLMHVSRILARERQWTDCLAHWIKEMTRALLDENQYVLSALRSMHYLIRGLPEESADPTNSKSLSLDLVHLLEALIPWLSRTSDESLFHLIKELLFLCHSFLESSMWLSLLDAMTHRFTVRCRSWDQLQKCIIHLISGKNSSILVNWSLSPLQIVHNDAKHQLLLSNEWREKRSWWLQYCTCLSDNNTCIEVNELLLKTLLDDVHGGDLSVTLDDLTCLNSLVLPENVFYLLSIVNEAFIKWNHSESVQLKAMQVLQSLSLHCRDFKSRNLVCSILSEQLNNPNRRILVGALLMSHEWLSLEANKRASGNVNATDHALLELFNALLQIDWIPVILTTFIWIADYGFVVCDESSLKEEADIKSLELLIEIYKYINELSEISHSRRIRKAAGVLCQGIQGKLLSSDSFASLNEMLCEDDSLFWYELRQKQLQKSSTNSRSNSIHSMIETSRASPSKSLDAATGNAQHQQNHYGGLLWCAKRSISLVDADLAREQEPSLPPLLDIEAEVTLNIASLDRLDSFLRPSEHFVAWLERLQLSCAEAWRRSLLAGSNSVLVSSTNVVQPTEDDEVNEAALGIVSLDQDWEGDREEQAKPVSNVARTRPKSAHRRGGSFGSFG